MTSLHDTAGPLSPQRPKIRLRDRDNVKPLELCFDFVFVLGTAA